MLYLTIISLLMNAMCLISYTSSKLRRRKTSKLKSRITYAISLN